MPHNAAVVAEGPQVLENALLASGRDDEEVGKQQSRKLTDEWMQCSVLKG